MISHTFEYASAPSSTKPGGSFTARFLAWLDGRRERARITRELLSCSNRELFDLGISSGDIPAIVRGTYRRN